MRERPIATLAFCGNLPRVGARGSMAVQSSAWNGTSCHSSPADSRPSTPSHPGTENPNTRGSKRGPSRAACGPTGRKMPDTLQASPAADPTRGLLDVRVREGREVSCGAGRCGFAGVWTCVGLSRGTDSELAVRSPRLSSARAVLRALDRVSGTRTRRPRPPCPRAAWVRDDRPCTSAWMWRARTRSSPPRACRSRPRRGCVRGGSAAGNGSRVSSILRPIAAASCSTRASLRTTRSRVHQSRRKRASGIFRARVRGGRWT
jgi:hypothetical protein